MSNACVIQLGGHKRGSPIRGHAVVDPEDYEELSEFRWSLNQGYAARYEGPRGHVRCIFMHRQLLGLEAGDERCADHVNRDELDNRRSNLRIATRAQNLQNLKPRGESRFRGVSRHRNGYWRACCKVAGKEHNLGLYRDEEVAGRVAAEFRREHLPFATD